jgi:opacity protein-like surface antigen
MESWHVGGAASSALPLDPWAPRGLTTGLDPESTEAGTIGYELQPLGGQGGILENRLSPDNRAVDGLSDPLAPRYGNTSGFMAKGYYDLAIMPRWKLFAGAGLGMARLSANQNLDYGLMSLPGDAASREQDQTVFAYQGMLGLSYEFSAPFQMYFGYRFFVTDPVDSRSEGPDHFESEARAAHSGLIGFRYNF